MLWEAGVRPGDSIAMLQGNEIFRVIGRPVERKITFVGTRRAHRQCERCGPDQQERLQQRPHHRVLLARINGAGN